MNKAELMAEFDESWCFLTISAARTSSGVFIDGWSFGEGSIAEYKGAEHQETDSVDGERDILDELVVLLNERRFEEVKLITPSEQTLFLLRSRLLASNLIKQPVLRGYPHIPLAEIIHRNIDLDSFDNSAMYQSLISSAREDPVSRMEPTVEKLWKIMTEIAPLLPPQELEGDPI